VDVEALARRLATAKNGRSNLDSQLQDIALRVLPQLADFNTIQSEGARRTELMFDATAALAAQRALAAITSFFWPSNQRYQRLAPDVEQLAVVQAVKQYMDDVTATLFKKRYSPRSAFEAMMSEAGLSFLVFGTGILFIDEQLEADGRTTILYRALPLSNTWIEQNAAGKIDTLHRTFRWTLRQLSQRFPGKLPARLAARLEKHPDETVEVAQSVCPRTDAVGYGIGPKTWPWASCYYLPGDKTELEEGGFRTWPFAVMRYMTATGEVYGRSPVWMAMSDIRVLNTMKRTSLAAAQKVADPPMLMTEDGVLGVFSQAPGSVVSGGLGTGGEPLVKPLISGARLDITLEMMDKEREIISSALFLDVFKALVDNPQMTATQALELMQERATLMAPIGGRIESEGLGPMTERELDILAHAGELPPMPQELIDARGEYRIEYTSPMRQAMRATEALAISRTFEQLIPLYEATQDAGIFRPFQMEAISRELADINGMAAKLLKSPEQEQAEKDAADQQANAQALVQAAPQVSAAAANIAKMQAAGGRPQI